MRVLSLFDGISCGMVALERASIPVERYVAYEIEENAIKVSKHNYPDIEQKGDVFKAEYAEGEFDLLIGGSPCTYWSIARCPHEHKRETTSSGLGFDLFMQYVRALRETKPKYFLYENNESMSDAIKAEITRQLGVEPFTIDSADFSAQIRKRYYWTNIPVQFNNVKSGLVFADIEYKHDYKIKSFEKYKDSVRDNGVVVSWDTSGKGNYSQQNRARRTHIKMNTLPSSGIDKNNVYLGGTLYRNIHPIEAERLQNLPDNYTSCINSNSKRVELCGNGWTVDVIAHILSFIKENEEMAVNKYNYFSLNNNLKYCGSSQFKQFLKCPAKAMAILKGELQEEDSTALLIGSYVDAWFEGTLDDFKAEHPEIFKKDGTLKADYEKANSIIERVSRDELFMKYMGGKKQFIKTGFIEGVPFKIKIDSYHKGKAIVDLKVIKDFKPIWNEERAVREDFIRYWGYDYQAAIYQAVEGNNLPFYICAVTKEAEPDLAVIQIPQAWIDSAMAEIKNNIGIIQAIKQGELEAERCESCDYCRSTKKLTRVISADELECD